MCTDILSVVMTPSVILGWYGGTHTPTFRSDGYRAVTAVGRLGYYSTSQIL